MSETSEVIINGKATSVPRGASLASVAASMGLDARFLVVEYNGEPHAFAEVRERRLEPGDRIELVRPVAGG